MKNITVSRIVLSMMLAAGVAGAGIAAAPQSVLAAEAKPTVSPAVGKPLQEAQKLLTAGDAKGAVAKAQEAVGLAKTPYEQLVANQILANAALKAGDMAGAVKGLEVMIASPQLPADQKTSLRKTVIQIYYQAKNYPKTIEAANAYLKENPGDSEIPVLVAQSYYLQNDFKKASESLRQVVKSADAAGRPVKEDTLQLLMSADYQLKNDDGVKQTLEMMVARYPKPQYMRDFVAMNEKALRSGTPSTKTTLDIYVIKYNAGLLQKPEDYTGLAELAIQDGLPGLAKKVMEKGATDGVLGKEGKDREARMLNMAATQADTDLKNIAKGESEATKAKTGEALIKYGEAYWSYGQYDKAIAATQAGIAKGVTDKDDAQLRLGIAYLAAGQRPKALEAWKAITPGTVAAQLASMWKLQKASA